MELTFHKADVKRLYNGDFELTLTVPRGRVAALECFLAAFKAGDVWDAVLKKHREKRSLDANSYCWVLLGKMADALHDVISDGPVPTKEELYRGYIEAVGVYEPLPVREDAVDRFCEAWSQKGIGWFVRLVDDSKLPGYKKVFAYYGSSTYDTLEMSRLIDNIVQDAKALGIETLTPRELERLKEDWR